VRTLRFRVRPTGVYQREPIFCWPVARQAKGKGTAISSASDKLSHELLLLSEEVWEGTGRMPYQGVNPFKRRNPPHFWRAHRWDEQMEKMLASADRTFREVWSKKHPRERNAGTDYCLWERRPRVSRLGRGLARLRRSPRDATRTAAQSPWLTLPVPTGNRYLEKRKIGPRAPTVESEDIHTRLIDSRSGDRPSGCVSRPTCSKVYRSCNWASISPRLGTQTANWQPKRGSTRRRNCSGFCGG